MKQLIAPLGYVVVMAAVSRSVDTDEAYGLDRWTFLAGLDDRECWDRTIQDAPARPPLRSRDAA